MLAGQVTPQEGWGTSQAWSLRQNSKPLPVPFTLRLGGADTKLRVLPGKAGPSFPGRTGVALAVHAGCC